LALRASASANMQYITVVEPVQTKSKRLLHGKMFQEEFSMQWKTLPGTFFHLRFSSDFA